MASPEYPYATLPPINVPVVSWPTNLKGCPSATYPMVVSWGEQSEDMRVRTRMSVGPPKTRRRYTMPMRKIDVVMNFPNYDFVELRAFFEGAGVAGTGGLEGGYKFFTFPNPMDGLIHYYRMVKPPKFTNDGMLRFNATMVWEEL